MQRLTIFCIVLSTSVVAWALPATKLLSTTKGENAQFALETSITNQTKNLDGTLNTQTTINYMSNFEVSSPISQSNAVSVPEPATLFALALGGLGLWRKRKK